MVGRMTCAWPLKPARVVGDRLVSSARAGKGQMTRRTLGAAVDERLERLLALVLVDHADERRVHPPARLDRVEPGDHEVELAVEGLGVVLDLVKVPVERNGIEPGVQPGNV